MNFPNTVLLENEPLSRHSSFKIGGPARLMLFPLGPAALADLISELREENPLVMGNGTNLLFPDEGFSRPVINTSKMQAEPVKLSETEVLAPCGIPLSRLAAFALREGLGGAEFAHGIPGTLGGAVFMNAGAYGGEMKDIVIETRCVDKNGNKIRLIGGEHRFEYRKSALTGGDLTAVESILKFYRSAPTEIKNKIEELAAKRRKSQPLEYPSAGSAFKRPKEGYAAAMIDAAGFKGFQVGGARVSEKHAGFIINTGGATCADVLELVETVRQRVFSHTGVWLEPEIRIIG